VLRTKVHTTRRMRSKERGFPGSWQIGGWRTRSVFDRYAIITEGDIADAVRKVDADRKRREALAARITMSYESVHEWTQAPARVANADRLNYAVSESSELGRDGGTGRRSGLKIRRASALGGSIPPPGTSIGPFTPQLIRLRIISSGGDGRTRFCGG
jgi:hypothetical protein